MNLKNYIERKRASHQQHPKTHLSLVRVHKKHGDALWGLNCGLLKHSQFCIYKCKHFNLQCYHETCNRNILQPDSRAQNAYTIFLWAK